ncbi:16a1b4f1-962c-4521-8c61-cf34e557d900 [Thermothielavioides terrestris]|uniref:16a1b4f1-962c-4521-8c61-cf34e557d900 n=1 Tax=Thermothielavioides terrestris TaxID=2587410 RepID=A0A3S4AND7_9PEZI|nr:16a1b4f1-962c-4521-8c61-cf34e557d900 [Thermothielavioides terrestris]
MSAWPDCLPFPGAVVLMRKPDSESGCPFSLENAAWPNLAIESALPMHVIKICAVGIHRDELESARDADKVDLTCNIPGYEFSGYEQSAAAPIGALAAYQALFDYRLLVEPSLNDWGRTPPGLASNRWKSILITGAATPVGVWAVQLARLAGAARVVGTCHANDVKLVLELGAHEAYDWEGEGSLKDWRKGHFSVVLDLMGGVTLTRAWRLVAGRGMILSLAANAREAKPNLVNQLITSLGSFSFGNSPRCLELVRSLARRGLVKPVCDPEDVFELGDFEKAMQRLSSHSRGQVVLTLDSEPPLELIDQLDIYGDVSLRRAEITADMIEEAEGEDDEEPLELLGWLGTVGSNGPNLAQLAPEELMPPPTRFLTKKIRDLY